MNYFGSRSWAVVLGYCIARRWRFAEQAVDSPRSGQLKIVERFIAGMRIKKRIVVRETDD